MKKYQINLLQKKDHSLVDKVIFFLLHYLRYIIVITQIVVISVFFLRFKLDQEIVDLKESVNQKQEIIKITSPLVEEVGKIKAKTDEINNLIRHEEVTKVRLDYIFSVIPEPIVIYRFDQNNTDIRLEGVSQDIDSIRKLSLRIKKDNQFKTFVIDKVIKSDIGYEFTIILTV